MKISTKIACLTTAILASFGTIAFPASAADDVVSKAYGVRVYHDNQTGIGADVVSFNVDSPNELSVEQSFNKNIRAAAYANGVYYMVESDDGMVAYRLSSFDLATKKYEVVKEYSLSDNENAMIFQCMTYDESAKTFYAYAFDIKNAVNEGETLDVPFCLYSFDVTTGSATLIGENTTTQILTLAADKNGILYGIDTYGSLYSINKETGQPIIDEGASYCEPSNLQSMAFDNGDNTLYWAGFKMENNTGVGFFGSFTYYESEYWWGYNSGTAVNFTDNTEIVGLYIDSDPLPKGTPTAVTELTLTPGNNGATEATLSWVNPVYNNGGNKLEGSLTVNIYRDNTLLSSVANQTPGEKGSVTITETTSGVLGYTVVAATADGEGRTAYVEGFVGKDTPGSVSNICISKASDAEHLTVTWTAPSAGAHGGWFDTASLTYKIVRLPDGKDVANALTTLSYTDTSIENVCGYSYTITPVNADGEGISAESPTEFAGKPLTMPFACDFSTDALVRLWKVVDNDNDGQSWYAASNRVESFMKYFPDQELSPDLTSDDWLISAPMKLEANKTYVMKYWVRSQGPIFPVNYNITIGKGATVDAQTTIVDEVRRFDNQSMEERAVTIHVDETGVYNIGFQALNRVSLHIKDITIEECYAVELAATSLTGFAAPVVGKASDYTVTIINNGYEAQSNFTVELVNENGDIVASATPTESVAEHSTTDMIVSWEPTETGKFEIYARVVAENDADLSNNTTNKLAVTVLENGDWINVATENMGLDGVVPFHVGRKYSLEQTIYNAADFNNTSANLKGMMLYYTATQNVEMPVKIAFANTDKQNFNNKAAAVPESEFTTVFEGTIKLSADQDAVAIMFEKPFAFNGTNLCMMAAHSKGDFIDGIYFKSQIDSNNDDRYTWYHFGNEPFDFPETISRYLRNRPSVSFFVDEAGTDGVNNVEIDENNSNDVRYYNLQGVRINNPANGIFIRVNGKKAEKVMIK